MGKKADLLNKYRKLKKAGKTTKSFNEFSGGQYSERGGASAARREKRAIADENERLDTLLGANVSGSLFDKSVMLANFEQAKARARQISVTSGQTIADVAAENNTTEEEIIANNPSSFPNLPGGLNTRLFAGQQLMIGDPNAMSLVPTVSNNVIRPEPRTLPKIQGVPEPIGGAPIIGGSDLTGGRGTASGRPTFIQQTRNLFGRSNLGSDARTSVAELIAGIPGRIGQGFMQAAENLGFPSVEPRTDIVPRTDTAQRTGPETYYGAVNAVRSGRLTPQQLSDIEQRGISLTGTIRRSFVAKSTRCRSKGKYIGKCLW